jgi:hypothetical protein
MFEGRGMLVAQQVIDQAGILSNGFGSFAVGNPCCLNDSRIPAHVIHETDKSFVQDWNFLIEQLFSLKNCDMRHSVTPVKNINIYKVFIMVHPAWGFKQFELKVDV